MEQFSLQKSSEDDSQLEIVHRICLEEILKDEPVKCDYEIFILNTIYPPNDPESILKTEEKYFLENWRTSERIVDLRANPYEQLLTKKRIIIPGLCSAAGGGLGGAVGGYFNEPLYAALVGGAVGGFLGFVLPEYAFFIDKLKLFAKKQGSKFILAEDTLRSARFYKSSATIERIFINRASAGKVPIPDLCKLSFGKLNIEKDWSWLEDIELNERIRKQMLSRIIPLINKLELDKGNPTMQENIDKRGYRVMLKDIVTLINGERIPILYSRLKINSYFNRIKKPQQIGKSFFKGNLLIEYERTNLCQKEIEEIICNTLTPDLSLSSINTAGLNSLATFEKNKPSQTQKKALPIYLINNKTGEETFGIVTINLSQSPKIFKIRYGSVRNIKYIEK